MGAVTEAGARSCSRLRTDHLAIRTCPHSLPSGVRVSCVSREGKGVMQDKTAVAKQNAIEKPFLWKTMDGEILTLAEMKTGHVFNSMKMCFNHLAAAWDARPVWHQHQYRDYASAARQEPGQLAWLVVMFIQEIEKRGDLPEKYREPYNEIVDQIRPKLPEAERLKLPAAEATEIVNVGGDE